MCSEFNLNYTIKDKIGYGTFSEVFKCQKTATGAVLAVKILKKQFNHIREAESLPELRVLLTLTNHVNVLGLLDYTFDTAEGTLFMVFELMEMSLYDMIKTRKRCLPETQVKHLVYQILKGLYHLHSHGIFHRDIKPENILIKKTVVKIADLGSVRAVNSPQPYTEYISTRWYRAPECILTSGSYGPKMDVWACGCVYYELLTSKPLFPGADELDQLIKIHQVIGTPSARVMMKMVHNKSRIGDIKFPVYQSVNLSLILPFTSDGGREILKRMLIYNPDVRSNVHSLLEHRYFNDLRVTETTRTYNDSRISRQWSAPTILKCMDTGKLPRAKLKEPVTNKKPGMKLNTNSWGPSSNTTKPILEQSQSKRPLPLLKKRPGHSPVKIATQKTSRPTVKPVSKQTVQQEKIKANTYGNLPTITSQQPSIKKIRTLVNNYNFKSVIKGFLPPIAEH